MGYCWIRIGLPTIRIGPAGSMPPLRIAFQKPLQNAGFSCDLYAMHKLFMFDSYNTEKRTSRLAEPFIPPQKHQIRRGFFNATTQHRKNAGRCQKNSINIKQIHIILRYIVSS